jgi:hypothetical protein
MSPMRDKRSRRRRRVGIDAAMLFIIVLLMAQMWLLTATLESFLAGHIDVALPGMLGSLVLFGGCVGIYRLVLRLDRAPDADEGPEGSGPWVIG